MSAIKMTAEQWFLRRARLARSAGISEDEVPVGAVWFCPTDHPTESMLREFNNEFQVGLLIGTPSFDFDRIGDAAGNEIERRVE